MSFFLDYGDRAQARKCFMMAHELREFIFYIFNPSTMQKSSKSLGLLVAMGATLIPFGGGGVIL